jgi:hypothetical protein
VFPVDTITTQVGDYGYAYFIVDGNTINAIYKEVYASKVALILAYKET